MIVLFFRRTNIVDVKKETDLKNIGDCESDVTDNVNKPIENSCPPLSSDKLVTNPISEDLK